MPSPCQSRRKRWAGYVARVGDRRGIYRVLLRKPEGKTPMDWIKLALGRDRWQAYVNAVLNLRVP
jgi:hypothetical protein